MFFSSKQIDQSLISSFKDKTIIRTSDQVKPREPPIEKLNERYISVYNDQRSRHEILISSSSWINVQVDSAAEPEPVKPPRLKKMARQKQQREQEQLLRLQRANSEGDVSAKLNKIVFSNNSKKPEISAPVLMATTLNPNDAEGHKTLQTPQIKKSFSVSSLSPNSNGSSSSVSELADKISFKELRRLSSLFPSLSGLNNKDSSSKSDNLSSITSRSSFYVAEAIYEEAASDHIYEEIPERIESAL